MAKVYKHILTVRVKIKTQELLTTVAKITGYPSVSAFLRDFIETPFCGDLNKMMDFKRRMDAATGMVIAKMTRKKSKLKQGAFELK